MRPNFALNLNYNSIGLLLRAKGGWRIVGEVSLEDPDLAENLRYLRRTATEMAGGQFATKLVIPNSQILFRDVFAPGDTPGARRVAIRTALDGTTPYALEDLVFDWSDAGGGMAKVAVVASVTLEEAEAFAAEHRFNPVSFVANPEAGDFTGEPWFGTTRLSKGLLATGETVERDDTPILIIGPAQTATPPADPVIDAATLAEQAEGIFDDGAVEQQAAPSDKHGATVETAVSAKIALASEPSDPATNSSVQSSHPIPGEPPMNDAKPTTPNLETAMAALAFSTRRPATEGAEADTAPLRLEKIAPRIAIRADSVISDEREGLPQLGNASRTAEVTHLSVTAPSTADDDRGSVAPVARKEPPAFSRKLNGATPPAKAAGLAYEPARRSTEPSHQVTKTDELTVFGARKKSPGSRPRYLGLVLTLALILALAAAALLSNLVLGDDPVVSRLFRTGQPTKEVVTVGGDTVEPVARIQAPPDPEPVLGAAPEDTVELVSLEQPETIPDALSQAMTEEASAPVVAEPVTAEAAATIHAKTGVWPLTPTAPIDPTATASTTCTWLRSTRSWSATMLSPCPVRARPFRIFSPVPCSRRLHLERSLTWM